MLVIFIPVTYSISVVKMTFPVLLHLNMLAIGLMLVFERWHCQNKPVLLKPGIPKTGIPLRTRFSLLIIPLTAITGCILTGLNYPDSQYIYVAVVLALAITGPWLLDRWKKNRPIQNITTESASVEGTWQKTHVVEGIVPQEMLEMLSNAIFAFALTLIIRTPIKQITESVEGSAAYPDITAYGINFLFIFMILTVFYILYFEIMHNTRVNDWVVVYTTFGFILSLLFIPLTSILWIISDKPYVYSIILHVNILITGLLMVFLWRHISTDPVLRVPDTDPMFRTLSLRLLLFPATAIAGLFLDLNKFTFTYLPFGDLYIIPAVLFVYLSRDSKVEVQAKPAET
jgi:uncharacterized membrane protein